MKLNQKSQWEGCDSSPSFVFQGKWPHLLSKLSVRAHRPCASSAIILLSAVCWITHYSVTFQQIIGMILNFNGDCWSLHHFQACCLCPLLNLWAGAKVMGQVLLAGWLVALHVCDPSEKLCSQADSSKTVTINVQQKRVFWWHRCRFYLVGYFVLR